MYTRIYKNYASFFFDRNQERKKSEDREKTMWNFAMDEWPLISERKTGTLDSKHLAISTCIYIYIYISSFLLLPSFLLSFPLPPPFSLSVYKNHHVLKNRITDSNETYNNYHCNFYILCSRIPFHYKRWKCSKLSCNDTRDDRPRYYRSLDFSDRFYFILSLFFFSLFFFREFVLLFFFFFYRLNVSFAIWK